MISVRRMSLYTGISQGPQGQYITHVINSSVARLQPLAFTKLATYSETSAAKSNFDILFGGGRDVGL